MKVNLRDLFWFVLIVAVALGWWVDRSRLTRDQAILQQILPPDTREPIFHAWKISRTKFPLRLVRHDEGGEVIITFGWSSSTAIGGGEVIRLKKDGNTWRLIEQGEYDA